MKTGKCGLIALACGTVGGMLVYDLLNGSKIRKKTVSDISQTTDKVVNKAASWLGKKIENLPKGEPCVTCENCTCDKKEDEKIADESEEDNHPFHGAMNLMDSFYDNDLQCYKIIFPDTKELMYSKDTIHWYTSKEELDWVENNVGFSANNPRYNDLDLRYEYQDLKTKEWFYSEDGVEWFKQK